MSVVSQSQYRRETSRRMEESSYPFQNGIDQFLLDAPGEGENHSLISMMSSCHEQDRNSHCTGSNASRGNTGFSTINMTMQGQFDDADDEDDEHTNNNAHVTVDNHRTAHAPPNQPPLRLQGMGELGLGPFANPDNDWLPPPNHRDVPYTRGEARAPVEIQTVDSDEESGEIREPFGPWQSHTTTMTRASIPMHVRSDDTVPTHISEPVTVIATELHHPLPRVSPPLELPKQALNKRCLFDKSWFVCWRWGEDHTPRWHAIFVHRPQKLLFPCGNWQTPSDTEVYHDVTVYYYRQKQQASHAAAAHAYDYLTQTAAFCSGHVHAWKWQDIAELEWIPTTSKIAMQHLLSQDPHHG